MKKFLIVGVYTEGSSKGRSFYLGKDGYVVDSNPLSQDCYDTERAAKMVATKKNKDNEFESRLCKYITPCRYSVVECEISGGVAHV